MLRPYIFCVLGVLCGYSLFFQNHFPVGNAGFVENRTDAAKSQLLIELDHRHLRVQIDCSRAQLLCRRNCPPEQFFPHAFTTITFEHRHAADFGATVMRHDSRGPNGFSLGSCQKMNRAVIVAIELDCSGHTLFAHKYSYADREGSCLCFVRRNLFYLNDCFHYSLRTFFAPVTEA